MGAGARIGLGVAAFSAIVVACGCGVAEQMSPDGVTTVAAVRYMNAALDSMEKHSINRYKIDWPSFRAAALDRITGARSTSDTYQALTETLAALGDNHSSFIPPGSYELLSDRHAAAGGASLELYGDPRYVVTSVLLYGDIGYISFPGFSGPGATAFADKIQSQVQQLDAGNVCGWIVDLRFDTGGNMWPMIAGIGPVLGDGDVGEFVDPDSVWTTWFYKDGAAGVRSSGGTVSVAQRVTKPYALKHPMPPVALIYHVGTASAGEAVAIAFRGRPLTRTFGRATRGLSTANAVFRLSDGAAMAITTGVDVDRTGVIYGGKLEPDVTITPNGFDPDDDIANQTAVQWLHSQTACSGS